MVFETLIGILLLAIGASMLVARKWTGFRRFLESLFLKSGDSLFDQNKPYSKWVTMMSYFAPIIGLYVVTPYYVLLDLVMLLVFGYLPYRWLTKQEQMNKITIDSTAVDMTPKSGEAKEPQPTHPSKGKPKVA